jgi:hypothetical protein
MGDVIRNIIQLKEWLKNKNLQSKE